MKPGRPLTLDMNRNRRLREGLRWTGNKPPRMSLPNMAKIGLLLIILSVLLPVLAVLLQRLYETQAELHHQRKVTQKYVAMLASAMNGKPLYDKISGQAFFFDKPTIFKVGN